jgi:putative FmdB family regulatory protein
MPIYAYKCESCGFAKDVLQKMSDAPLTDCPSCAKPNFQKQVTAAGFQLKGSGWYATDFKGSGAAPATAVAPASGDAAPAPAVSTETAASTAASSKTEAAAPVVAAPAKPAASAS